MIAKINDLKVDKNNELINDHLLIANKFNDYFATIGSVINNKIPSTNGNYKDYFNNNKKDKDGNLLINCNNSLFLSPANFSEIEK